MSSPANIDERDDMLAAEYAVGTLPHDERVSFEKRLAGNPALQERVAWWDRQLAPLAEAIEPVAPPSSLQARIQSRLFGPELERTQWWDSVGIWRGVAIASLVGLIVAGGLLFNTVREAAPDRNVLVAQVAGQTSDVRLTALYDEGTSKLRLKRTAGQAAAGRDLELWIIAGGNAPVSLGVLPASSNFEIEVPAALQASLVDGAVLAISDEPSGGSPTGQPTGDVLATGAVTKI